MKFISHGRSYEVDRFGVIVQTDHRPFIYDHSYAARYDDPEIVRKSETLQALRLGFVCGSHGMPITSIMDVGYGNGAFINRAKTLIPYVYGYDITGVKLEGAYQMPEIVKSDVTTFWDVLEHFHDLEFLRTLDTQTICISLPYCHFVTEGKKWFDNAYIHRKPDEHIRHFNEISLSSMMESYGWKTVAISGYEDIVRKSTHDLQNILSMSFKRSVN